jgi:hypothetical protein
MAPRTLHGVGGPLQLQRPIGDVTGAFAPGRFEPELNEVFGWPHERLRHHPELEEGGGDTRLAERVSGGPRHSCGHRLAGMELPHGEPAAVPRPRGHHSCDDESTAMTSDSTLPSTRTNCPVGSGDVHPAGDTGAAPKDGSGVDATEQVRGSRAIAPAMACVLSAVKDAHRTTPAECPITTSCNLASPTALERRDSGATERRGFRCTSCLRPLSPRCGMANEQTRRGTMPSP